MVKDELVELLGGEYEALKVNSGTTVLMLCGLQGSGKTTTAGKLAKLFAEKNIIKNLY